MPRPPLPTTSCTWGMDPGCNQHDDVMIFDDNKEDGSGGRRGLDWRGRVDGRKLLYSIR